MVHRASIFWISPRRFTSSADAAVEQNTFLRLARQAFFTNHYTRCNDGTGAVKKFAQYRQFDTLTAARQHSWVHGKQSLPGAGVPDGAPAVRAQGSFGWTFPVSLLHSGDMACRLAIKNDDTYMTQRAQYPALSAWPTLAAPAARCQAFNYGRNGAGRRFLVIPARMLAVAGLVESRSVYVSVFGERGLVTGTIRTGQRRALTGSAERGAVLQLTLSRLPTSLGDDSILVAGKGYVALVPASDAAQYAHLPEFEKHDGMLKEETVESVDAPLQASPAILWRELTTATYGRAQRCLDVTGNVWSVAGFELDSPLRVTRFSDGVLVEKVSEQQANSQLRSKMARGKRAYAGKRFGRAVLSSINGDRIRVIAMPGALALVGESRALSDFGLSENDRRGYDTPATAEDAAQTVQGNTAVIALNRREPQVHVLGAWLTNYGFVPGQRYSIEPHPLIRNRMLAVLDDSGEFKVTRDDSRGSRMHVPMDAISHFRSPALKVVGTREGLHLQQHFVDD